MKDHQPIRREEQLGPLFGVKFDPQNNQLTIWIPGTALGMSLETAKKLRNFIDQTPELEDTIPPVSSWQDKPLPVVATADQDYPTRLLYAYVEALIDLHRLLQMKAPTSNTVARHAQPVVYLEQQLALAGYKPVYSSEEGGGWRLEPISQK
jgi:hypothetical protein